MLGAKLKAGKRSRRRAMTIAERRTPALRNPFEIRLLRRWC